MSPVMFISSGIPHSHKPPGRNDISTQIAVPLSLHHSLAEFNWHDSGMSIGRLMNDIQITGKLS